jgi:pimeloyl-ACP methyl ester carboxylesterase
MAAMHERIAGSTLVTIEDASHLCFAEKPEQFNQTIKTFFERTELSSRP